MATDESIDDEHDAPVGNIHDDPEMEYWILTSAGIPGIIESGYTRDDEARLFAWIKIGGRYDLVKPKRSDEWAAVRFIDARTSISSIAITFPRPRGKRGFLLIAEDRPFSCREIFEIAKGHGAKKNSSEFYNLGCRLFGLNSVVYCGPHSKAAPTDSALSAFARHWRSLRVSQLGAAAADGKVIQVNFSDAPKVVPTTADATPEGLASSFRPTDPPGN